MTKAIAALPDGSIAAVRPARLANRAVEAVYELLGGDAAFAEWARENPTDYYTKMFAKTMTKTVEHGVDNSVEAMLDRIEGRALPAPIEAEYVDAENDDE